MTGTGAILDRCYFSSVVQPVILYTMYVGPDNSFHFACKLLCTICAANSYMSVVPFSALVLFSFRLLVIFTAIILSPLLF